MTNIDVLIITALKEEYDAASEVAKSNLAQGYGIAEWEDRDTETTTPYTFGTYVSNDGHNLNIALARPTRMGSTATGPVASSLVERLKPRYLAMCGVCAGNPADVALGDVIVSEMAYQYDEGKQKLEGFEGDHRQYAISDTWLRTAQELTTAGLPSFGEPSEEEAKNWLLERLYAGDDPRTHPARARYFPNNSWRDRIRTFESDKLVRRSGLKIALTRLGRSFVEESLFYDTQGPTQLPFQIKVGPIASGNVVVKDGLTWDKLKQGGVRSVLGLEMEAATIGSISHRLGVPQWVVVKGVMDHADPRKEDRYKPFAARASAEVLFKLLFHQLSKSSVSSDRSSISADNTKSENPNPDSLTDNQAEWNAVTFIEGRDIGPALLGRGLGPGDALACPRLKEADSVVSHLTSSFFARLVGAPGCGKSVSAYQAAHTLFSQGWSVARLTGLRNVTVNLPTEIGQRTLFLIDDAHLLRSGVLQHLEDQTGPDRMLLSVHTVFESTICDRGAIQMDSTRAVATIAKALKANLQNTLNVVKRVDNWVGERSMDEDLTRRIDAAQATSSFPWQFCFILGGGWHRASETASASRNNEADLLLAIAAVQQLASRDAQTDEETILRLGVTAGLTIAQIRKGLSWLLQQRLLLSSDDLRCPHQRFASAIIPRTYSGFDRPAREAFARVCRAILVDEEIPLAGTRIMIHELRFADRSLPWVFELSELSWIDDPTFAALLSRCWRAVNPQDRMFACLTMSEIGKKNNWRKVVPEKEVTHLAEWFSRSSHPTGFGLCRLLNDISNDDKPLAAQIVAATDPVSIARIVSMADPETAFSVSEMIDRLAHNCDDNWEQSFIEALDRTRILATIRQWPEKENIYVLSGFCFAIWLFDKEFAFEILQTAMPLLQRALADNPVDVFSEIDEIVWHILHARDPFGQLRGKHAPDRRQISLARDLCMNLEGACIADKISATPLRKLQPATYFLDFLCRIAPRKYAVMCSKLDWDRLDSTIGDEWGNMMHDTEIFLYQAATSEKAKVAIGNLLKGHLTEIQVMPTRIALLFPQLACQVVKQGGRISIDDSMAFHWPAAAYVVQMIGEQCSDLIPALIAPHEGKAAEAIQSWQTNLYDDMDMFLSTLQDLAPQVLERIVMTLDPSVVEKSWGDCLAHGRKPARSAAWLVTYCLKIQGKLSAVATRLRRRFPTASYVKNKDKSPGTEQAE